MIARRIPNGTTLAASLAALLFPLLSLVPAAPAIAQAYPTKVVNMVVPFTAGGPTDRVARDLAEAMRKSLGQQVIVENAGGAGGTIGTAKVARSAPDGYNVLLMHIGYSTAPALYRKLPYDPNGDLVPVGGVVEVPMTLIARPNFPAANFKEFLAYAKANKAKLNFANAGIGAASHLCGLMFMSAIETDFQTVPFKGTADAITALLGGQVDFLCDQTTNTTQQIKANRVKAYGVTTKKRVSSLPDLPTLDEQGLKDFSIAVWHGMWVPKGTPQAVVDKLSSSLQAGLKDPAFRRSMTDLGAEIMPDNLTTPVGFGNFVKGEIARWAPIIKKAGVYAD